MMKCPIIYVVIDSGFRDLPLTDCKAWFFDENEAVAWAEKNAQVGHYWEVHSVPGPEDMESG
jgi:hypothetical protein